jgi:hypothetical protein
VCVRVARPNSGASPSAGVLLPSFLCTACSVLRVACVACCVAARSNSGAIIALLPSLGGIGGGVQLLACLQQHSIELTSPCRPGPGSASPGCNSPGAAGCSQPPPATSHVGLRSRPPHARSGLMKNAREHKISLFLHHTFPRHATSFVRACLGK